MEENIKPLKFKYKNWKGITAIRTVIPEKIYYGSTEFHKESQWLMEAFDLDKDATRTFAVKDILAWVLE